MLSSINMINMPTKDNVKERLYLLVSSDQIQTVTVTAMLLLVVILTFP